MQGLGFLYFADFEGHPTFQNILRETLKYAEPKN